MIRLPRPVPSFTIARNHTGQGPRYVVKRKLFGLRLPVSESTRQAVVRRHLGDLLVARETKRTLARLSRPAMQRPVLRQPLDGGIAAARQRHYARARAARLAPRE